MFQIVIFMLIFGVAITVQENKKYYGKFDLVVNDIKNCKGPKIAECSDAKVGLSNRTTVFYNITVLKPVKITKGKILTKVNGKDLLRFQMSNPCTHLFLREILVSQYHMGKDCMIQKGNYQLLIDLNNLATQYYGGSFVYGNVTFQTIFIAEDCNFSCTIVEVTMQPKTTRNT